MRRGAGGTRKLPAERVVRPRRSPNAEHPSPLTLRNQCAPQRLSFLFGKKGTYLAGPSIIQRPSLSVQSPVRSSDNLFDPASVLLNGRVSQLAQNPDPSSRPNCSSDFSWVSGPARQRTHTVFGSAVARLEYIFQTKSLFSASLSPLRALLRCTPMSPEPTGSRIPF